MKRRSSLLVWFVNDVEIFGSALQISKSKEVNSSIQHLQERSPRSFPSAATRNYVLSCLVLFCFQTLTAFKPPDPQRRACQTCRKLPRTEAVEAGRQTRQKSGPYLGGQAASVARFTHGKTESRGGCRKRRRSTVDKDGARATETRPGLHLHGAVEGRGWLAFQNKPIGLPASPGRRCQGESRGILVLQWLSRSRLLYVDVGFVSGRLRKRNPRRRIAAVAESSR